MHNDLGNHAREEEPEQAQREAEVGPIVPVLHHLQTIPLEIHFARKVHLVECLHGDLALAAILLPIVFALEGEVVLHGPTGVARFFIFARRDGGGDGPEDHNDGYGSEGDEEKPCEEATAELSSEIAGDEGEEGDEQGVGELLVAGGVGGEGPIFDGRVLVRREVRHRTSLLIIAWTWSRS